MTLGPTCVSLQDKAKPRPFHVVDRVLRLELGAGAEEVFAEFSAEATAAASLAQVGGWVVATPSALAVRTVVWCGPRWWYISVKWCSSA